MIFRLRLVDFVSTSRKFSEIHKYYLTPANVPKRLKDATHLCTTIANNRNRQWIKNGWCIHVTRFRCSIIVEYKISVNDRPFIYFVRFGATVVIFLTNKFITTIKRIAKITSLFGIKMIKLLVSTRSYYKFADQREIRSNRCKN